MQGKHDQLLVKRRESAEVHHGLAAGFGALQPPEGLAHCGGGRAKIISAAVYNRLPVALGRLQVLHVWHG
jgi:hypothetical protein